MIVRPLFGFDDRVLFRTFVDVRRESLPLKHNKTCGGDLAVPEMWMATSDADWHWAAAFNQSIANLGGGETRQEWFSALVGTTFAFVFRPSAMRRLSSSYCAP